MKKAGFIVVAALVCAAVCQGQQNANPAADFRWETNRDGGITITGYAGQSKTVVIPGSIDGKPVTAIGHWAFSGSQLTGITIPNSVTSIGGAAFSGNQLTGLTVPNSVTGIGAWAFYNNQLTSVTIPNSVTAIGELAFDHNQLTSVTIPDSVPALPLGAMGQNRRPGAEAEFSVMRYKNTITIIGYNREEKNAAIPGRIQNLPVVAIGDGVFANKQLTGLTIPNSVTSIGDGAFIYNQLTSVTIPDSVTSIGDGAFYSNRLTGVTIPNSVTAIGDAAFAYNQLTGLTIPNSVTAIGDAAFYDNQLTSVTIGANVAVDSGAFGNDFQQAYHNNGTKAGTYTLNGGSWTHQAR